MLEVPSAYHFIGAHIEEMITTEGDWNDGPITKPILGMFNLSLMEEIEQNGEIQRVTRHQYEVFRKERLKRTERERENPKMDSIES